MSAHRWEGMDINAQSFFEKINNKIIKYLHNNKYKCKNNNLKFIKIKENILYKLLLRLG
jgi:hypothetical protein